MVENKTEVREKSDGPLALAWRRFLKHRLARISMGLLFVLVLSALCAPWLTQILGVSFHDTSAVKLLPPSLKHLLGTDDVGRDMLARLLYGGQISLTVGIISALMSALIGTLIGASAGYFGGAWDTVLMRFTDAMLSLPTLPLMILLAAVDLEKALPFLPHAFVSGNEASMFKIMIIIVFFGWMSVARLVRGSTLSLKEREFVLAANAVGVSNRKIILRHIVPNCVAPIIVASTLAVGGNILYESVLSFLGLGIQPPIPSWGNMLTNSQEYMRTAPLLAFYPGFLILMTVVSFNFIGDGLRDAFDPRFVMGKK
ncbi:MAG: ABC transporter permease [Deltaproteobacteria bacterium]|nr:ABC transporter permease [Deltaproteobacteria bacterium]